MVDLQVSRSFSHMNIRMWGVVCGTSLAFKISAGGRDDRICSNISAGSTDKKSEHIIRSRSVRMTGGDIPALDGVRNCSKSCADRDQPTSIFSPTISSRNFEKGVAVDTFPWAKGDLDPYQSRPHCPRFRPSSSCFPGVRFWFSSLRCV